MSDDLLSKLIQDFDHLASIPKPFDREYERIKRAQAFELAHGLSVDDYTRLFELYLTDRHLPDWLEKTVGLTKKFQVLAQTFQSFAFVAIFISALQFLYGFRERQARIVASKWEVVASDMRIGSTKKSALEYLHDRGEQLSNIEAVDAHLSNLNLPGAASLQESDFRGANLYHAYLRGANLYRSDFSNYGEELTNLEGVNFQDTDLRQANFQGVNLQFACFRDANLEQANFDQAYLVGTDFRGARYLTPDQIRGAGQASYSRALFDQDLADALELEAPDAEPVAKCSMKPRDRNWWRGFIGH